MPIRPFVFYVIGLLNAKEVLADHRYDQILRCHDVERWSETTCQPVGDTVINGQRVSTLECDGDCRTLACAEASGGGQGGEEAEFFSGGNGNDGQGPGIERGSQASLLIGISVRYFVGNMVGGEEGMGMAGNQIDPVDAKEVDQDRGVGDDDRRPIKFCGIAHLPRATSARLSRMSPLILSILLISRTRPREISSRR